MNPDYTESLGGLPCGTGGEGSEVHAVAAESLDVHVGHDKLRAAGPAAVFSKHRAVLGHEELCVEDKVGGALSEARGGIDIGAETACALAPDEVAEVSELADQVVAGAEIHHHFRPGEGRARRRRHGSPQVLADFRADEHSGGKPDEDIRSERHGAPFGGIPEVDRSEIRVGRGIPPAALVELIIVRDI